MSLGVSGNLSEVWYTCTPAEHCRFALKTRTQTDCRLKDCNNVSASKSSHIAEAQPIGAAACQPLLKQQSCPASFSPRYERHHLGSVKFLLLTPPGGSCLSCLAWKNKLSNCRAHKVWSQPLTEPACCCSHTSSALGLWLRSSRRCHCCCHCISFHCLWCCWHKPCRCCCRPCPHRPVA